MRIDDEHADSFLPAPYLEARAKFLEDLHRWTDRLPGGIVDIEEEQTDDAGYFVKFVPANAAGCHVGIAYYGISKRHSGADYHSLDLAVGDGKRTHAEVLTKSSLSLEPVLEILEAARQGRITQYCWPCHTTTEIRLRSTTLRYKEPLLPFLEYFDELFVKRLFRRGPRRVMKYESWIATAAGSHVNSK